MFCLFHKFKICLIISLCVFFLSRTAFAIPALSGSTGIITQPSAETLNAGNICVGVWSVSDSTGTIVPVTITIGLGTFLEAYGSFPNITLNGDENDNPRGFANVGMKLRFWGKRSARLKLALEGEMRRWVSDNINTDGLTDTVTRLVASYKLGRFGFHLNGGYSANEDPIGGGIADQTLYGGAVEFLPTERLRLVAEYAAQTHRDWTSYNAGVDGPSEATFAVQYHLSPHLTLNLGMISGLNDATDEWKFIFGFSSCQGIGTYQRELPRPAFSADTAEEKKEVKKIIKVRMLKPLRGAVQGLQTAPLAPVTKLEVPVVAGEEIILTPSDRLTIAGAQTLKALSVAPVGSAPAPVQPVVARPNVNFFTGKSISAKVYRKFRLPGLGFGFDQSTLSPETIAALDQVAEQLRKDNKWFFLRIDGHTDSVGSEQYNQDLSLQRAISAATRLAVSHGIESERIFIKGFGESTPIGDNLTKEGRVANRRVEILVLIPN
ncbi:MAG: OmpA family protein [Desulfuromonadales bacterium]|nr:OmpA family protein [Desulfuromonadales bacterium]